MFLDRAKPSLLLVSLALLTVGAAARGDVLELVSPNEEAGGFFGAAVDTIPDVNGDGVDDVIVGAPEENGGGVNDAGRVYIFSGATGGLIRGHSSPNDTVEGDYGFAVAGVADLNGDGRGDYVVGAPGEPTGGKVYVYSGATGALIRTHSSPNAESGGRFGRSVSFVPDATGDGRGDYVVGANEENGARGRVYLFSGNTGNLVRTHNSPSAEVLGLFGNSVSGIPDVNNDGRGDYIVGAPGEDPGGAPSDAGRAYVYNGINGALLHTLQSPNQQSGGNFGWSVGGGPDVGGNGFGDVIVGAPRESVEVGGTEYADGGRAYLFSGTSGAFAKAFQAPDDELNDENLFGWIVDGMADRDGDGLGELLVGAPGWPGYHVYRFGSGPGYALEENIDSPDNLGANQFFGGALAGGADFNGDGLADFVIGGRGSDNFPEGPSESGRAYLHRSALANNACSIFSIGSLQEGPNPFSTIGATGSGSPDSPCLQNLQADIWFTYTATCTGPVTFSTCGSATFNTVLAVYDGCGFSAPFFFCDLAGLPFVCSDNFPGCVGSTSQVTLNATAGDCFTVRLGGFQGAQGIGVLTVTAPCSCPEDLNNDGQVNGADLGILLSQWGGDGSADLDGNNVVNGADLGLLLSAWGGC